MIGLFFVLTATFFEEMGSSIGKFEFGKRTESIYTMGFLSLFWGAVFLLLIAFVRGSFIFSSASLPTLGIRLILEIIQAHVTILAITRADRSTFGFLRILTVPLLLGTDLVLGYAIGLGQIVGIGFIMLSLAMLFMNHGLKKRGALLVAFTAVNAVATISLYKYNITHFNSVEVEQSIVHAVLLLYFLFMALFVARENPMQFFKKPIFFVQSFSSGIGTVLMSFAYLFAPASIITTAKRSFSIMWAMLSGNAYFDEKKFFVKFISLILIGIGLILLIS